MNCSLCMKYNCLPQNGMRVWNTRLCQTLREESTKRHLVSGMHKLAVDREREALKATVNGGVNSIF